MYRTHVYIFALKVSMNSGKWDFKYKTLHIKHIITCSQKFKTLFTLHRKYVYITLYFYNTNKSHIESKFN
jgi:hypothetical protein